MATCQPAARHCEATVDAADPVPITTRSNVFVAMGASPSGHSDKVRSPECLPHSGEHLDW